MTSSFARFLANSLRLTTISRVWLCLLVNSAIPRISNGAFSWLHRSLVGLLMSRKSTHRQDLPMHTCLTSQQFRNRLTVLKHRPQTSKPNTRVSLCLWRYSIVTLNLRNTVSIRILSNDIVILFYTVRHGEALLNRFELFSWVSKVAVDFTFLQK